MKKKRKKDQLFPCLISSCLYPLSWFSFLVRSALARSTSSDDAEHPREQGAWSCGGSLVPAPSIGRAALAPPAGAVRLLCLLGAARVAAQATSGEGRRERRGRPPPASRREHTAGDPSLPSLTRRCCYSGSVEPSFPLGQRAEVVASREDERGRRLPIYPR